MRGGEPHPSKNAAVKTVQTTIKNLQNKLGTAVKGYHSDNVRELQHATLHGELKKQ